MQKNACVLVLFVSSLLSFLPNHGVFGSIVFSPEEIDESAGFADRNGLLTGGIQWLVEINQNHNKVAKADQETMLMSLYNHNEIQGNRKKKSMNLNPLP